MITNKKYLRGLMDEQLISVARQVDSGSRKAWLNTIHAELKRRGLVRKAGWRTRGHTYTGRLRKVTNETTKS